jgi:hypothetical protein
VLCWLETSGHQRCKDDKYTLKIVLDQPCRFHHSLGRLATHTTRQCSFIKDLEPRARQFPGPPPEHLAKGQGDQDREHEPALVVDQGEDDYPANIKQYHIIVTQEKDKRNDL